MTRTSRLVAGVLLLAVLAHASYGMTNSMLGAKIWNAKGDDAKGLFWGPTYSCDLDETWWFSVMALNADLEYPWNDNVNEKDAEIVIGMNFEYFDLGVGIRYTTTTVEFESWWGGASSETRDSYGPMVYVGTGMPIGDSGLGWYLGGSYLLTDLGDYEETHYNVEGGLSYAARHFLGTLGYRVKSFSGAGGGVLEANERYDGVTVSAGYKF